MSMLVKYFVGLLAIFCLMQFVEMARLRRDDAANANNAGNEILDSLKSFMDDLKTKLESDDVKKFLSNAGNALSESAKKIQEELARVGTSLTNNNAPAAAA